MMRGKVAKMRRRVIKLIKCLCLVIVTLLAITFGRESKPTSVMRLAKANSV